MPAFDTWQKHVFFLTLFTLILTIPFWLTDLDLMISGYFYNAETHHAFPLKYHPFWYALYKLIPILSVLVAISSLAGITISYLSDDWRKLRKPSIAIFLTFLLGPGLLVNGIFKEHYGRPRPAQIENFEGKYNYVPPLVYGGYDNAKSFPSGHSSVAFAFIIFYFLLRHRKPTLAKASLVMTLLLGCATGMARVVGGGHFLSDVLWSCYMVTVTAIIVNHFIVERNPAPPKKATKKQRMIAVVFSGLLSIALLVWLLVSLPFEMHHRKAIDVNGIHKLNINVAKGFFDVVYTDEPEAYIENDVEGYGFRPMIHCKHAQNKNINNGLDIQLTCSGWFREARQSATVYLPKSLKGKIQISKN